MSLTEKKKDTILKLWRDPEFSGAFSGLSNFRTALKMEKDIDISKNELMTIMFNNPNYVVEMRRAKHIKRREMNVHGFGTLFQADLAYMFPYNNFKYFLLVVDVFSRRIFCRALKTKSADETKSGFESIFEEAGRTCNVLETDQGTEFKGCQKFFKDQGIYYKIKIGANKASFAEYSILRVKSRMFKLLRTFLSKNWPKYLGQIVKGLNDTPNSAIGNLKPSQIKSNMQDPMVDEALGGLKEEVDIKTQEENQKKYEKKSKKFQIGDYVYADFPHTSALDKSFDSQRGEILQIRAIDAGFSPVLYQLKDTLGDDIPGRWYVEQLKPAPNPENHEFKIEKILDKRRRKGENWVLVKWQFYPKKHNSWVKESTIIDGPDTN